MFIENLGDRAGQTQVGMPVSCTGMPGFSPMSSPSDPSSCSCVPWEGAGHNSSCWVSIIKQGNSN